jgi:ribonuclease HI
LIHGLRVTVSLGIMRLIFYGDSKVVIDQVNKACDIKKNSMNTYYSEVRKLEAHFMGLEFHHVCRDNNMAANVLSKIGSKHALVPRLAYWSQTYASHRSGASGTQKHHRATYLLQAAVTSS